MTNSAVSSISDTSTQWVGEWSTTYVGVWLDYGLLLVIIFLLTVTDSVLYFISVILIFIFALSVNPNKEDFVYLAIFGQFGRNSFSRAC